MIARNKTLVLFTVVAYVVSLFLSGVLWGTSAGAWLLLAALVPCAITVGWVKLLFLRPRLQSVPGFLRGAGVGLISYLSFGLLAAVCLPLSPDSGFSGLRQSLWSFLVAGTAIFGPPLVLVGAVTGFIAEKLFGGGKKK